MSKSSGSGRCCHPVVGVDPAQDCRHLTALGAAGHVANKARCMRATLLGTLLRLVAELIAIENCARAHELARQLMPHGRDPAWRRLDCRPG
ncbi:MAG: hypothetical protein O9335_12075 [Inhella sp.]|uniref:hypothetical protein n=1 Tax=Inhella sp. TaxID=1921806 RepID=UPI0022BFB3EF|nr:hypothetical protein [Inhella sp.]MCZ8235883.1 hypothetical protein [Inhella sp.]